MHVHNAPKASGKTASLLAMSRVDESGFRAWGEEDFTQDGRVSNSIRQVEP